MSEPPSPKLKLSKLDSVEACLRGAVCIFFGCDNPIAVHLLAASANEVLAALGKHAGRPPMIKEVLERVVRPEHRDEVHEKWVAAQNFFKHADRDPEREIEYDPRAGELLLLESINEFILLSGKRPDEIEAFRWWKMVHEPEMFLDAPSVRSMVKLIPTIASVSRSEFFDLVTEAMRQYRRAAKGEPDAR